MKTVAHGGGAWHAVTSVHDLPCPPVWRPGNATGVGSAALFRAAPPATLSGAWLAIGNFDGMHRGHRALIDTARSRAEASGAMAGLLTFEPHPRSFFRPLEPVHRLTPPELKLPLAGLAGASFCIELTFDAQMAAMTAEAFIDDLLLQRLDVGGVVVGPDFHFGRGRAGDAAMLIDRLAARGRGCEVVAPVRDADGAIISSSRVRLALAAGDVGLAGQLLGYAPLLRAEIVHGDKRGRDLGYPTANMRLPAETGLRHGIYAAWFTAPDGMRRAAVASFGRRPTFDDGAPRLETHVFDFAGDLYGQICDVALVEFIRPEMRFDNAEALIVQMDRDSAEARAILARS